jgi:hypothetical protein
MLMPVGVEWRRRGKEKARLFLSLFGYSHALRARDERALWIFSE